MHEELLQQALNASRKGQSYAFATIVESSLRGTPQKIGAKMVVMADGTLLGTIGGGKYEKEAQKACLKAIKSRKPSLLTYCFTGKKGQPVCGGQIRVFIEPHMPIKHLVICGAGHIGLPLSAIAKMLNFKVTVIDNRNTFASKKRFPHVDKILLGQYGSQLSKVNINRDTYIAIVTQGHHYDWDCLKTIIHSTAGYIGVIASKTKRQLFLNNLRKRGIQEKFLKQIKIPAGLDIGAQSPQEIAVSIMAEMIAEANKDFLGSAKFQAKEKP